MHEMALAQNILDIALKAASDHGAGKILRITIRAGQLRGIVPEQLKFCFGFVAKETPAQDCELVVKAIPVKGKCKRCGDVFFVREYRFECSTCKSDQVEVVQGMELMVENIEVEDGDDRIPPPIGAG